MAGKVVVEVGNKVRSGGEVGNPGDPRLLFLF